MSKDDAYAEDNYGFSSGRCPKCHRRIYSDTGFWECQACGWSEDQDHEEEKDKDNEDEDC